MSAAPDLVLHVGMPYAGGDVLRKALVQLRPQLSDHGVTYLDHAELIGLPSLSGWVAQSNHDAKLARRFEGDLAELVTDAEVRTGAQGDGTVLISSERLLGAAPIGAADSELFRPKAVDAIGQVIAALNARRTYVVLYTRRQDRLLEHALIRRVMAGDGKSLARQYPFLFEPVLDYGRVVERIEAMAAVARVVVKPYEAGSEDRTEFVADFLDVMRLRGSLDLAAVGELRPGQIYSSEAVRVSRAMIPHLDTPGEHQRWRSFALKTFGTANADDDQTRLLSDRDRARILAVYATANRELFRSHVPRLPESTYRTDEPVRQGRRARGWPRLQR